MSGVICQIGSLALRADPQVAGTKAIGQSLTSEVRLCLGHEVKNLVTARPVGEIAAAALDAVCGSILKMGDILEVDI